MKNLCRLYDIKITFSSVNDPQSNGSLERFHATLLEMIRAHKLESLQEYRFFTLQNDLITRYISVFNTKLSHYYKVTGDRTQTQKEKSKIRFDRNVSEH